MLRASRSPRVRAMLATIRRIHVFRLERPSKRSEALEHAEPRLLHDLLRDRARAHVRERDPQHQRPVLVHERHERVLVAGAQTLQQRGVGVDGDVFWSGHYPGIEP